jgi:hypothetical protein
MLGKLQRNVEANLIPRNMTIRTQRYANLL